MSCTKPLKGFPIGLTDNNKTKYKITNYKVDYLLKTNDEIPKITCHSGEPFNPDKSKYKLITDWIQIPCGKCPDCRLSYSRQWADRCLLELQQHEESCFITLTYDDLHLPMNDYVDDNGCVGGQTPTLVPEHVQLFIKKLRSYIARNECGQHIKFFCTGEYGSRSHRPHYHLIIFGWRPKDLVPYKQNFQNDWLYNSPSLNNCWKDSKTGHPRGFVVVGDVTWESCAYVARYILKKQYGEDAASKRFNFYPEFTRMSLKPAIGKEYFEKHGKEIFETSHISVSTDTGGRKIYPSRYYEKLFEDLDPDAYGEYKEKKLRAVEAIQSQKGDLSNNRYLAMLQTHEDIVKKRIENSKRSV